MKITIDKKYTTLDKLERTKQQIKEFKEMLTDNDLLSMFGNAIDEYFMGDIVYCNLSAYPGGTDETDETHYSVDILLDGYNTMTKIHFYISQSGEIRKTVYDKWDHKEINLWSVKTYKAE